MWRIILFIGSNSIISSLCIYPFLLNFKIHSTLMKINTALPAVFSFLLLYLNVIYSVAQTSPVQNIFPAGTVTHSNIPYANDTLQKHLLDIYLPAGATKSTPLVIWIHGGAWMLNDKYADMGYMKETVKGFIDNGYALAS